MTDDNTHDSLIGVDLAKPGSERTVISQIHQSEIQVLAVHETPINYEKFRKIHAEQIAKAFGIRPYMLGGRYEQENK